MKTNTTTPANYNIFVVEDDPFYNAMITKCIESLNDKVVVQSFYTGEACMDAVNTTTALIVTDFRLNDFNPSALTGEDLVVQCQSSHPKTPVVVVSGEDKIKENLEGSGAMEVLAKDQYTLGKLQDIVLRYVNTN